MDFIELKKRMGGVSWFPWLSERSLLANWIPGPFFPNSSSGQKCFTQYLLDKGFPGAVDAYYFRRGNIDIPVRSALLDCLVRKKAHAAGLRQRTGHETRVMS